MSLSDRRATLATPPAGEPATAPAERRPLDLRLVPGAVAAWGSAALAWELTPRATAWWAAGCCLAGATLLAVALRRRPRPLVTALSLALLGAAAGAAVTASQVATLRSGPWPELTGRQVTVEARVTEDPRQARARPDRPVRPVLLTAEVSEVAAGPGQAWSAAGPVLVVVESEDPVPWLALLPSTTLRLTVEVGEPMPHRSAEWSAVLRAAEAGAPEVVEPPDSAQRFAGLLRAELRETVAELPPDAAALLPALIVGDVSGLPAELNEAVLATGLSHLIVVSGGHLAVLFALLIGTPSAVSRGERGGLAARLGVPLRTTALLGGLLLLGFLLVCRPGPSVLRAALCGGIALLAVVTGRHRALLPTLAIAALLLVLHDPALARSFGFLLSVLATGALLLLAPGWSLALQRRGVPGRLADGLAVAAAAHLVCAPVVTVFAGRVSLVAVPCNLLVEPAVAPLLVLGWAVLLTAPLLPPLAEALAWLAAWPARWIAVVARGGASLPGAEIGWPGGWWGAALLALVSVSLVILVRRARRRRALALVGVALLLLAVLRPAPLTRLLTGWPPGGWRLVACDVGQGDALVLSAGPGTALVVDAGPDPASVDRCLTALGVRRVPLLVLTHFHADHVGGVAGVLRGREVAAIETGPVGESAAEAAGVARSAAAAGVPVRRAVPGERRAVGAELSWRVLWPPAEAAGLGDNDASVTLLLRSGGLTVLLPGDLEPRGQEGLLAAHPELGPVDVLKVPHHGSGRQHPPLLRALRPRLALISAGADNGYGHPAPDTVAALADGGAVVLRTDAQGALAVVESAPGAPGGVVRRGRAQTSQRPSAISSQPLISSTSRQARTRRGRKRRNCHRSRPLGSQPSFATKLSLTASGTAASSRASIRTTSRVCPRLITARPSRATLRAVGLVRRVLNSSVSSHQRKESGTNDGSPPGPAVATQASSSAASRARTSRLRWAPVRGASGVSAMPGTVAGGARRADRPADLDPGRTLSAAGPRPRPRSPVPASPRAPRPGRPAARSRARAPPGPPTTGRPRRRPPRPGRPVPAPAPLSGRAVRPPAPPPPRPPRGPVAPG